MYLIVFDKIIKSLQYDVYETIITIFFPKLDDRFKTIETLSAS